MRGERKSKRKKEEIKMTSLVWQFNLWYSLPTLLLVLAIAIYAQRERFNRAPYSNTETFALLNIVTLGPFALMGMFGILSTVIRKVLTNPFWFPWEAIPNISVYIPFFALVILAYLYVLMARFQKQLAGLGRID
ncbi:hypothetical protein ES708_34688 [subsurface metagenome]